VDFLNIGTREIQKGKKTEHEIFPDFIVGRSKDLMVRGRAFYAIWDEELGLWSTDEYDVQRLVDAELKAFAEKLSASDGRTYKVKYLRSFGSQGWTQFRKFLQNVSDNSHQLDESLTFANTPVKKTDYASMRLPYSLVPGEINAWNEIIGTLYSVEERRKIEWAIGSVISGDSKKLQKFLVFYGPGGTGKSTIMNVINALFEGYTTAFEAKALGSANAGFALEPFKNNPLVGIQQDGDLSKIEDNTRLNSVVSHEKMTFNEKFKPSYTSRVNAFLFMGTNLPVKISDAKSGIIRRLVDVHPTGVLIPANHYNSLISQIDFELGAIAYHCLEVYRAMGKNYYNTYRPIEMMFQTDIFFNFIEAFYDLFKSQNGATLKQAYTLYKEFCSDTGIERPLPQYKVREELRNYFDDFQDRADLGSEIVRSYYSGFNANKFKAPTKDVATFSLVIEETESLLDELLAEMPAQLATKEGTPKKRWADVKTSLEDIDSKKLHYVKVPENHIVIDFDLKDIGGTKSLERNLEAASNWPATYAELSKSGAGVHLHYTYDGDAGELNSKYSEGIEIKVYPGDSALRRRLSKCNNVPIATINSGLPIKEKTPVLSNTVIKSERGLRELIIRNLRKEIHPGTKPSIDFIKKILDDAKKSGMIYDVTDMRARIIAFANNSTNKPLECLKIVQQMQFTGADSDEKLAEVEAAVEDDRITFFDVEVYPNLFVVCWKYNGSPTVVRMINPSPQDIEKLFSMKLVGFFNRKYDNHILWARYLGYDNDALYRLSSKLVNNNSGMFGEAYNVSYTDIYDFSSKKQGLKKFEIELGIHHLELDIPWDQPVPEDMWDKVVEYCVNDVVATEAVFEARKQDFVARQILADLSGLSVNDTTQKHTAKIVFGSDRNPQSSFVYTRLEEMFEGYKYELGKSTYRDEAVNEGGYVYAEPGMYEDVALLDIASMHPTSIELLNLFGDYTPNFAALKAARMAIKHKDYDSAKVMLGGRLAQFLDDQEEAEALSYALKIVINIVYGLTSAKFDNPFRDPRNKDNIVAKRGALFMIDLKHAVQERGFTVAHIKTDSIKIPNATPEIIEFVMEFGAKYGYTFEHEATYKKFCLVNDAVYVAKNEKGWNAVGAQFQHPYVFKSLFSKESIVFDDMCETKQVSKGAMYLDFDSVQKPMFRDQGMHFVGRTGRFVPVTQESGGGILYRRFEDKNYAVTGTKGHFWIEAEHAEVIGNDLEIDTAYFDGLVYEAIKTLDKFGHAEDFVA
jgi:energy-coupling factor transporter ATP-binding protein EcfA2